MREIDEPLHKGGKELEKIIHEFNVILETPEAQVWEIQTSDKLTAKESIRYIRGGQVDERSYVWIPSMKSNNLLGAFASQYFYFRNHAYLRKLIEDAASRLRIKSLREAVSHINTLARQLAGSDSKHKLEETSRINGSSLHLLCDILGISVEVLEGEIERITGANGHGGIRNPCFPTDETLELLKARLIGIAVSDCHLPKSGSLELYEGSLERIERVKKLLDHFGITYGSRSVVRRKGDYAFYIASPVLRALEFWGIPTGDRTILNYGLPNEAKSWTTSAIQGYFQEMLAQEGNIDKNGVINWPRSHAVCDGKKGIDYGFQSKLTDCALNFLRGSKKMRTHKGMVSEKSIPIGILEDMSIGDDEFNRAIGTEILFVVFDYRNRLIDDEKQLCEKLGIEPKLAPVRVSYFPKSDRASIRWQARIIGISAKIRSALLISPNHESKDYLLQQWLYKQPEDVILGVKKQIEFEGMSGLLRRNRENGAAGRI